MRRAGAISSPPLKTISGLNGALPTTWDAGWQLYTDLTKEQIAAFQAMPEWQIFVADHTAWEQSPSGVAPSLTVEAVQTLQGAVSL